MQVLGIDSRTWFACLVYLFGFLVEVVYLGSSFGQMHYMVSDGLELDPAYRWLMSVAIVLSTVVCLLYLYTFHLEAGKTGRAESGWVSAGRVFALLACVAWFVLANVFDPGMVHNAFAVAFIVCTTGCILCLLEVSKRSQDPRHHGLYNGLYYLVLLASIACVAAYLGLYLKEGSSGAAWVVEHIGLIAFLCSQFLFFAVHSFDRSSDYIPVVQVPQAESLLHPKHPKQNTRV